MSAETPSTLIESTYSLEVIGEHGASAVAVACSIRCSDAALRQRTAGVTR
jgi:hypothetical protein